MINLLLIIFVSFFWGVFLTYGAAYLLKIEHEPSKFSSILYALNGCTAALIFSFIYIYYPAIFYPAYFIFISALLITNATDLHAMLISRFVTLYIIPFNFLLSWLQRMPLSLGESIFGAFSAYVFLRIVDYIYLKVAKKSGMGEGDAELLAFIGSFLGPMGWWFSLLLGSCMGSLIGIGYAIAQRSAWRTTKLPFGPFLVYGALCFLIAQRSIYTSLFKIFISLN